MTFNCDHLLKSSGDMSSQESVMDGETKGIPIIKDGINDMNTKTYIYKII